MQTTETRVVVRIEVTHVFPVVLQHAFASITNMNNWPRYWPDFVRIENREQARWSMPGDRVTVVQRLLGQEVPLHMELEECVKDQRICYRSRQQGVPEVRHERHFKSVSSDTEYRLVVQYVPRSGFGGFIDRFILKRAVARALRKTIANLQRMFELT